MKPTREIEPRFIWDGLLAISLVGIGVSAWFGFSAKAKPNEAPLNTHGTLIALQNSVKDREEEFAVAKQHITDRTWNISADAISSRVLEQCNTICLKNHLTISRFRVASTSAGPNLTEAPMTLVVEGKFLDVMALVKAIEEPNSKLALADLKVNRSNNSTSVSANLALTAFIFKEGK